MPRSDEAPGAVGSPLGGRFGPVALSLGRSGALAAAVLLPGLLLSASSRPLGALWMLVGSFLMMASRYRRPWRLGPLACLLPAAGAGLSYLVQLGIFPTTPPSGVLGVAVLAGAGLGWWRGSAHEVFVRGGKVFAQRTVAFLAVWFVAYAASQVFGLLRSTEMAEVGLAGGAFATAMLVVAAFVLLNKRSSALSGRAGGAVAVAVGFLVVPSLGFTPQVPQSIRDILADDLAPAGYVGGTIQRREGDMTRWSRRYTGGGGALVVFLSAGTAGRAEGAAQSQNSTYSRTLMGAPTGAYQRTGLGQWGFVAAAVSSVRERIGDPTTGPIHGVAHRGGWLVELTWEPPFTENQWRIGVQRARLMLERIHGQLADAPSALAAPLIPGSDPAAPPPRTQPQPQPQAGAGAAPAPPVRPAPAGSIAAAERRRLEEAAFLSSLAGSLILILVSMGVNAAEAARIAAEMVGGGVANPPSAGGSAAAPPPLPDLVDPYTGDALVTNAGGQYWDPIGGRWVDRATAEDVIAGLRAEHDEFEADRVRAAQAHAAAREEGWEDLRRRSGSERLVDIGYWTSESAPAWLRERYPDLFERLVENEREAVRAGEFHRRADAVRGWMEERYPDHLDRLDRIVGGAAGEVSPDDLTAMRRLSEQIWSWSVSDLGAEAEGWRDIADSQRVLEDITWEVIRAGATMPVAGVRGGAMAVGATTGFAQHWRDGTSALSAAGAGALTGIFNQIEATVGAASDTLGWAVGVGSVTGGLEGAAQAVRVHGLDPQRVVEGAQWGAAGGCVGGGFGHGLGRAVGRGLADATDGWAVRVDVDGPGRVVRTRLGPPDGGVTLTRGADGTVRVARTPPPELPDGIPVVRDRITVDTNWPPNSRMPEGAGPRPEPPILDPDGGVSPPPGLEPPAASDVVDGGPYPRTFDDAAGPGARSRVEDGELAGQTQGTHAGEGGVSPESVSRMRHNDFYEYRNGRLTRVIDPSVIDMSPGRRGVIYQVDRHTGTVTRIRVDERLSPHDRTAVTAQARRALDRHLAERTASGAATGTSGAGSTTPPTTPALEGNEVLPDGRIVIEPESPQAPAGRGSGPPLEPGQTSSPPPSRTLLHPDGRGYVWSEHGVMIGRFDENDVLVDLDGRPIQSVRRGETSGQIQSYQNADGDWIRFKRPEPGTLANPPEERFIDGDWHRAPRPTGEPRLRSVRPSAASEHWETLGAHPAGSPTGEVVGALTGRNGQRIGQIDVNDNLTTVDGEPILAVGLPRDGRIPWYRTERHGVVWTHREAAPATHIEDPFDRIVATRMGRAAPEDLARIQRGPGEDGDLGSIREGVERWAAEITAAREARHRELWRVSEQIRDRYRNEAWWPSDPKAPPIDYRPPRTRIWGDAPDSD
ncbi:MAG: hypothetical protein HKN71_12520 [Gemmatimonadetes bacterium]|nr:hypothetical protein [Gemmatimonadota bacterium]